MKVMYDVLLNFSGDQLLDFYEWENTDDIWYVKKIPLIKIDDKVFREILLNQFVVNQEFLIKIQNCKEIYGDQNAKNRKKEVKTIKFCCLFTDKGNNAVVAVLFNNDGTSTKKSLLQVDELVEACDIGKTINDIYELDYKILQSDISISYLTREERTKTAFMMRVLNKINDEKFLSYLYYECFGIEETNINAKQQMISLINDEWTAKHNNLYGILKAFEERNS